MDCLNDDFTWKSIILTKKICKNIMNTNNYSSIVVHSACVMHHTFVVDSTMKFMRPWLTDGLSLPISVSIELVIYRRRSCTFSLIAPSLMHRESDAHWMFPGHAGWTSFVTGVGCIAFTLKVSMGGSEGIGDWQTHAADRAAICDHSEAIFIK